MQLQNCVNPFLTYNRYANKVISCSCGHCPTCLSLKQSVWVDRLGVESDNNKFTLFFTLTYDEYSVPRFILNEENRNKIFDFLDVCPADKQDVIASKKTICSTDFILHVKLRDVQLFLKRLRKYAYTKYGETLRYYIVSEYGPKHMRPHYHGLLFFNDERFAQDSSQALHKAWPLGFVDSSFSRGGCAEYCSKYVNCVSNLPALYLFPDFKTFRISSRSPSIGTSPIGTENFSRFLFQFHNGLFRKHAASLKDVSFWQSLKNRLFPRPVGFNQLSGVFRDARLRLFESYGSVTLKEVVSSIDPSNITLINRVKSDYYKSRQACRIVETYRIPWYVYLYFHDLFYYTFSMSCLSSFYELQENFQEDSRYLVNLYFEDLFNIKNELYEFSTLSYSKLVFLKSFGFTECAMSLQYGDDLSAARLLHELNEFDFKNSVSFKSKLSLTKSIFKHSEDLRLLNEHFNIL